MSTSTDQQQKREYSNNYVGRHISYGKREKLRQETNTTRVMGDTYYRRSKKLGLKSFKLTFPKSKGNNMTHRRAWKSNVDKVVLETIDTMKQDIRSPGGYHNGVFDACSGKSPENTYFGRIIEDKTMEELYPTINNQKKPGHRYIYSYAQGSGKSTIGKHGNWMRIHPLTTEIEELLEFENNALKEAKNLPSTNLNSLSVKTYCYNSRLSPSVRILNAHVDVTYGVSKEGIIQPKSNNSQKPGTCVVIITCGDNKFLKFSQHQHIIRGDELKEDERKKPAIDNSEIVFDLKHHDRFLLHPDDEVPNPVTKSSSLPRSVISNRQKWIDSGKHTIWKHSAQCKHHDKHGAMSVSLLCRESQQIAVIDEDNRIVGLVDSKGLINHYEEEHLPEDVLQKVNALNSPEHVQKFEQLKKELKESYQTKFIPSRY